VDRVELLGGEDSTVIDEGQHRRVVRAFGHGVDAQQASGVDVEAEFFGDFTASAGER
jgi:hypothetical protein